MQENMNDIYAAQINESMVSLYDSMQKRVSAEDILRIKMAYELAFDAHKNQFRKSGEPYIIHPVTVAMIVAQELELGANPVIASLLHDVVEDTDYTIEDIRERFGDDVAFLVGVVTKQKKESYVESKQVDNYRQILESVQFDVRAILIKLADRLHNMRTLDSMRADKQMKIAGETDYFFAPLANRLGLYHIKSELENLSFRYRCPREYAQMEALLLKEQEMNRAEIEAFVAKVNETVSSSNRCLYVQVRCRTPYSVWRKMQNTGCDFNHVDGKHYIRVVFDSSDLSESFEEKRRAVSIYSDLTSVFKERPGSVINYIDSPKENGYQSFHVKLLNESGVWEEVHISSDNMVRKSRLGCSAERTEENVTQWIMKFKEVLKDVAFHSEEIDYMDGVTSSFYNDDIRVITRKGDEVILPKGATALDFAFEVYGKVALHAVFARINGKLHSLKTQLRRGDRVEIGLVDSSTPDRDWVDSVLTYKAKRYLKGFFSKASVIEYERCPHCHPLPLDEVVGFKGSDGKITLHKRNCQTAIRLASQRGDSIVAVDFKVDEQFLYPVSVQITSVDRYHLLSDLIECITERLKLSIIKLHTVTVDRIVTTSIDFMVHSSEELECAELSISAINGVDEVHRVDIE